MPPPSSHLGREILIFSAIACLLLCFLFRDALLHGHVLGQADFLLELLPWGEHKPAGLRANNRLLGDIPALIYPFLFHAREAVRAGELPLWASGIGAGHPFLASFQTAALSPFTLLDYILPFPAGFTVDVAARIFVGGLGMFLFLRSLPLGFAAAAFGGVAYLLNPFSIVWLEHPLSAVAAFLPWLLLTVDLHVRDRDGRSAGAIAVVTCASLLAGHPETAFKVVLFAGAYALFRAGRSWRAAAAAGLAMSLGVLLAAVQILPFLEYLSESRILAARGSAGGLFVYTRPLAFVTAFVPDFFGTPLRYRFLLDGTNYCEQQLYAGIVTIVMAAIAIGSKTHRQRVCFFLAATVLSVLIMYGSPAAAVATTLLPPLKVAVLSRFGLIAIAATIVAAAIGLDELTRRARASERPLVACGGALLAATAVVLVVAGFLWSQHSFLVERRHWAFTLRAATWTAELLAASVAAVWLVSSVKHRAAAFLPCALLAVDLLTFADGFHGLIPRSLAFPEVDALAAPRTDPDVFRVAGWGNAFLPNTSLVYGLQDFRSYDGIGVRDYMSLLDIGFFFNGSTHELVNTGTLPLVDLLNIKYVLTPADVDLPRERFALLRDAGTRTYLNRFAQPRAFLVDATHVADGDAARRAIRSGLDLTRTAVVPTALEPALQPERADSEVGSVEIVGYQDHAVSLRTRTDGRRLLVLSDVYYPGWIATVDGAEVPIQRVNFAFRGVTVPAGVHALEFRYRPASFRYGVYGSLAGMALCGLLWTRRRAPRLSEPRA